MNFLEKNLEDIVYTNPVGCYNAGLEGFIDDIAGAYVHTMRQVQLEPYGIADIVRIVHASIPTGTTKIQVIECKRGNIGIEAYAQVKRYMSAVKAALNQFAFECTLAGGDVEFECMLIGNGLEGRGQLLYVLHEDPTCSAYIYEQQSGGAVFFKVYPPDLTVAQEDAYPSFKSLVKKVNAFTKDMQAKVEADNYLFACEFAQGGHAV